MLRTHILAKINFFRQKQTKSWYICTCMTRLIDDISTFLNSNGFSCSHLMQNGIEVISVNLQNGHIKTILPLEVSALTQEEARSQAEETDNCIRLILSCGGEYPLIITEDRWNSQRQCTEARLLAHIEVFNPIYARNCEVKRIDKAEAKAFLEANHSYGYAACKYCYGLFLKRHTGHIAHEISAYNGSGEEWRLPGTLVAVATFSNARKWIKEDMEIRSYEWTRYASLPDVRLSGGMGRLLKAFIKEVQPDDIMSYADLEWSIGNVYDQLGFELEGQKAPVAFEVEMGTWKRSPIKSPGENTTQHDVPVKNLRFFQNFGSNKYRLKLTDYK